MNGGGNQGPVIKPIQRQETAHGEWLVVDKRRKNQNRKKHVNDKSMSDPTKKGKEPVKAAVVSKPVLVNQEASIVFTAGLKSATIFKAAGTTNGKKQVRRNPPIIEELGRVSIRDGSTKENTKVPHSTKSRSNAFSVSATGATKIYTLKDGTQSTMPLLHQGGSRYTILVENDAERPSSFEPGQHSGVPPDASRQ